MRLLKTHENALNSSTSTTTHQSIYLISFYAFCWHRFFFFLSLFHSFEWWFFSITNVFHSSRFVCLTPEWYTHLWPIAFFHRADKWYSSVLHTKPRASHSSWWYGIQNGLIIINRMQINTDHLNIRIDFSDEHHFGDLSSNSIILFNVIFFLLLLIN